MIMSIHLADNTTQDMVTWSCRFIYPLRTKSHDPVSSSVHSGQSHMIMLAHLSTQDLALHVHVCSSITEYHSGHGRYMFMSARLIRNTTQDMAVTCLCLLVYHGIPLRTWPLHVHVSSSVTEYHSGHGRYMFMSARLSRNTTQDIALHVHVSSSIKEYRA